MLCQTNVLEIRLDTTRTIDNTNYVSNIQDFTWFSFKLILKYTVILSVLYRSLNSQYYVALKRCSCNIQDKSI